jgi:hypothetical protein
MSITGQEISGDVIYQMSVTADASGIKLSGDADTPGNSKYYGTSGAGAKGYHDLPVAGAWDGDLADVDFTTGTDIGADLADTDEIIVGDDSAAQAPRVSALSRLWTYVLAKIAATLVRFTTGYVEGGASSLTSITSGSTITVPLDGRTWEGVLPSNVTLAVDVSHLSGAEVGFSVLHLEQDANGYDVTSFPATWFVIGDSAMPTTSGQKLALLLERTPSGDIHMTGTTPVVP